MTLLVVAALSARQLAQTAARDGFDVVALDVFGDADTRQAAIRWQPIGDAGALCIDPPRLLAALHEGAARGDAIGWVAGTGFEARPDLLEAGARVLPLLGTAAADVRRLRDPATFFGFLQRHALAHPAVCFEPPPAPAGWLSKDAGGSGGGHIRPAADLAPPAEAFQPAAGRPRCVPGDAARRYFQRLSGGVPMSATFLASAAGCRVLGLNRLLVRPLAERPFVFHGVIGPLDVAPPPAAQLEQALRLIVGEFGLRGLGSLDFLLDGDRALLLEVNPRPPASMALYDGVVDGGLMTAHVLAAGAAMRRRTAAAAGTAAPAGPPPAGRELRGIETVFTPHDLAIDAAAAQAIAQWPGSHDWPMAGMRFAAGEPLCSVSAAAVDADAVLQALASSRAGLLQRIAERRDDSTSAAGGTRGATSAAPPANPQHHSDHDRRETSR